ncbi:MAG: metal-dependent hydrolase [Acidobacteriia bacterium]|nr:metal-dependent hydrolase [Terriglobia bacterium]
MFIGHFGVGLGAKQFAPRVSLGTLLLSAQLVDLLWPVFLLVGLERVRIDPGNTAVTPLDFVLYPYTHSLLACLGWGLLAGLVYFAARRDRRGASVVGLAVVSHWVLDWISHRPDLPLLPGGPKVGLGLWNSVAATVLLEGAIFGLGLALYSRSTRARDRVGGWSLWALVVFLAAGYIGNLLGPPPPSEKALAWVGLAMWLLVPWGYWIDRHRAPATR